MGTVPLRRHRSRRSARPVLTRHRVSQTNEPPHSEDTELLERLLRRCPDAWRTFHCRFDPSIKRSIRQVTRRFGSRLSVDDEREIFGSFLLALHQRDMHRLRSFDSARGTSLGSWFSLLARRCAWDYLRRLSRRPTTVELTGAGVPGPADGGPFEAPLTKERRAVVREVLRDFSERDQAFVKLYFLDALQPSEVAARMEITVATVYSKKHKIADRLQRAIAPLTRRAA